MIGCWLAAILLGGLHGLDGARLDDRPPRPQWRHEIPGWGEPAADHDRVYALTPSHGLVALDARTGALRWSASTGANGGVTWGSRIRLAGRRVVVGDGGLTAFDAASGRRVWRYEPPPDTTLGPYLGDADDDLVFAGSSDGRLFAVDARTGRLRWAHRLASAQTIVFPPARIPGGVLAAFRTFDRDGHGGLVALDRTGRRRWRFRFAAHEGAVNPPVTTSTVAILATTGGDVVACALADGHVTWRLAADARVTQDLRALVLDGHQLVISSLTGDIVGIDVDSRVERWRYAGSADGAPLRLRIEEGLVLAPYTSGALVALSVETGAEQWRLGPPAVHLEWPPALVGRTLVATNAESITGWALAGEGDR